MSDILHIHSEDNVVIALVDLSMGREILFRGKEIRVCSSIPTGHKMSVYSIAHDSPVVKYGRVIGYAKVDIQVGEHVHVHNVKDPVSDWKKEYIVSKSGERFE
jgi:altronate hydrolase